RVGETRIRGADVRLIAATNRDLDAAAANGLFREDLLFRLNVIEFTLPPLRQRSDRIDLANHLLAFFARQIGKRIDAFTLQARQALLAHSWPANLLELRNAIERAVIFASGRQFCLSDLPGRVAVALNAGGGAAAAPIEVGLPVSLEQL